MIHLVIYGTEYPWRYHAYRRFRRSLRLDHSGEVPLDSDATESDAAEWLVSEFPEAELRREDESDGATQDGKPDWIRQLSRILDDEPRSTNHRDDT